MNASSPAATVGPPAGTIGPTSFPTLRTTAATPIANAAGLSRKYSVTFQVRRVASYGSLFSCKALFIGKMKSASEQTLMAVSSCSEINDPKDRALVVFAQSITKKRGRPDEAEVQAFLNVGFTKQQIFEVLLIVSIKTLSNYINHLTNPEINKELLGA